MATASVTNTFVAATAAVASEVNTNFNDLVTFLNNSVIHKDGSKAMTGALDMGSFRVTNVATPTAAADAARFGDAAVSDYQTNTSGTTVTTGGVTAVTFTVYAAAAGMARIDVAGNLTLTGATIPSPGLGDEVVAQLTVSGSTLLRHYSNSTVIAFSSNTTAAATYGGCLVSLAAGTNTIVVTLTRVNVGGATGGTLTLGNPFRAMIVGA